MRLFQGDNWIDSRRRFFIVPSSDYSFVRGRVEPAFLSLRFSFPSSTIRKILLPAIKLEQDVLIESRNLIEFIHGRNNFRRDSPCIFFQGFTDYFSFFPITLLHYLLSKSFYQSLLFQWELKTRLNQMHLIWFDKSTRKISLSKIYFTHPHPPKYQRVFKKRKNILHASHPLSSTEFITSYEHPWRETERERERGEGWRSVRPNRDALTTPFSFLRLAGREEWVPINEDGLTRVSGPLDSALISPSLSSFQRRHAEEAGARVGGCCPPPRSPPLPLYTCPCTADELASVQKRVRGYFFSDVGCLLLISF